MEPNTVTPEKTRFHHIRRIGRLVINVFIVLVLSILGSAAVVLTVDYFMFRSGTWSGWQMVSQHPSNEDIEWWKSQIGKLPPPTTTGNIVMPATVRGRNGLNSNGMDGAAGSRLPDGLLSVKIKTESKWIRGRVLVSPTKHAWHMGVELPGGMAVERIYIDKLYGGAPPHPTYGEWDFRILPLGLALNSLYAAGPVCVVVTLLAWVIAARFRKIRSSIRRARGRCEMCAYILIAGQNPCPECGHNRKLIAQVAAN